ncbi:Nucleolar protein 58 [Arthromyces matolae]|nr:Nucleolar protein 58 [Arthromyces matolae]
MAHNRASQEFTLSAPVANRGGSLKEYVLTGRGNFGNKFHSRPKVAKTVGRFVVAVPTHFLLYHLPKMLVLYETAMGYCLFKVSDEAKISNGDLWKEFETPEKAAKLLKLKALHRFTSTATAVEDVTAIQNGKLGKGLKQFLTDEVLGKGKGKESLLVVDSHLSRSISKKLSIDVSATTEEQNELWRGIRQQITALLQGLDPKDLATMSLGLSHSLSRFKLKFSPDKVDTMVVQAIALLDDLDKEINTYAMRVKEWYGWHFPEMAKIISDNVAYAKVIRLMGVRSNAASTSFAAILPEDLEAVLKAAAEISMGTEISDSDISHIHSLCDQVIAITSYRTQLAEYLRNRMNAIAPNLTALVGELVGARLISHAGSLLNLAKHPASTVQILGAEKALFRALKTKHDTPKYGLIYHASLIGQAPPKLKGKMARMVATKAALSIRVDALTDSDGKSDASAPSIGIENRAKLESRLRALEYTGDLAGAKRFADNGKKQQRFEMKGDVKTYNTQADAVDFVSTQRDDPMEIAVKAALEVKEEKRKAKEERKAKKKAEKDKSAVKDDSDVEMDGEVDVKESKKDKKRKRRESEANGVVDAPTKVKEETEEERKARKKARKAEKEAAVAEESPKKKKKKSA